MTGPNARRLTLAAAALLATAGAHAATVITASGSCGKGVGGSLDFDPSFVVSCPSGTWADPRPGTASVASWSASVAAGRFRATASSAVNTLPPLGQSTPLALGVSVSAIAGLSDDLLFDAPGLAGTMAKMTFAMRIDGHMSADNVSPNGNAASRADWAFRANTASGRRSLGSTGVSGGVTNFYDWGFEGVPDVDGLFSFELPVVLGQTVTFGLSLEASAYSSGWRTGSPGTAAYLTPVQSSAASNFGNTASWQGITSLRLNDGTPLLNWTLSSSSGFDYASAVPEPGTWSLLAGGLALLAVRHARRERARASISA